ncbi:MAG: hypothetical protein KF799_10665 [Bdellovibrionales bacterium]|nr:hypothetical protein [Bdellovibrionales bacterium]
MNVQRVVLLLFGAAALSACSATKFSSKSQFLAKTSVMSSSQADDAANGVIKQPGVEDNAGGVIRQPGSGNSGAGGVINQPSNGSNNGGSGGVINQPSNGGNAGGSVNQPSSGDSASGVVTDPRTVIPPPKTELAEPGGDGVAFVLTCSDAYVKSKTSLKRAFAEGLAMTLSVNDQACTSNTSTIKSMIYKKGVTYADLAKICPSAKPASGSVVNLDFANASYRSAFGSMNIVYAANQDTSVASEVADALCDNKTSPLVIHVNSDPTRPLPIALSSQEDGVMFDILGAKNDHRPVRISWFTNHEYGMLALPDARGRVRGIDQLFGNATLGPDQKFAADGYAALAKYDGTTEDGRFQSGKADGFIDQRDAVYSRLRVWMDRNHDGIAQAHELISLRQAGISYIDLDFSTEFAETDQYGNQTLMKSIVGRIDGSIDLIFDLWFSYKVD